MIKAEIVTKKILHDKIKRCVHLMLCLVIVLVLVNTVSLPCLRPRLCILLCHLRPLPPALQSSSPRSLPDLSLHLLVPQVDLYLRLCLSDLLPLSGCPDTPQLRAVCSEQ